MYSSINGAFGQIFTNMKTRSATHTKNEQYEKAKLTINLKNLIDMWEKQNGKCIYSKIQMEFDKNEFRVSAKKLDNSKGYIEDNIVLCCTEFNGTTDWSSEKIIEMQHIVDAQTNSVIEDDNALTLHFKRLLYQAVSINKRHEEHNETKQTQRYTCDFDIDIEFLTSLFKNQNGKCAYSGMPFNVGNSKSVNWTASLEKINKNMGYTKNNVKLICLEFNRIDNVVNCDTSGNATWSVSKFKYIYAHIKHNYDMITYTELCELVASSGFEVSTKYAPTRKVQVVFIPSKRSYSRAIIFAIKSPSGKEFIGHCPQTEADKNIRRIVENNKNTTKLLNAEIEHYGIGEFTLTILSECDVDDIANEEIRFIKQMKTLHPHGLNVNMQPSYVVNAETRAKIANTLINSNARFDHNGNVLPKYMKYIDWKDRRGYGIASHPKCIKKDFASTTKRDDETLTANYNACIAYLQMLNT